jgi:hypothetical protein
MNASNEQKIEIPQQVRTSLEVLANLIYLAKSEAPGSASQITYLTQAENELKSLGEKAPAKQ